MSTQLKVAIGAVISAVIILFLVWSNENGVPVTVPTPVPSITQSAVPSPTASPSPSMTPSPSASSSPSPSVSASPSPSASPTPSVTPSPSPSASPSPNPSPSLSPSPSPTPIPTSSITAIWANDGGDKVTQDELRVSSGKVVTSSVWDGTTIKLKAAKNEVVGFNLVLESVPGASNVQVALNQIGPITSSGTDPFNWTGRPIELFLLKYLQIKGLSKLSYETYDERHVPKRFQRPWTGNGIGSGGWVNRPDADKFYPDIAVPMETVPNFAIAAGKNQSVWVDVYVPKTIAAGTYSGSLTVTSGSTVKQVPVSLQVYNFTLPDVPSAKTMVFVGGDLTSRYLGVNWPNCKDANDVAHTAIRDKHFQILHRHKMSVIDANTDGCASPGDRPIDAWLPRLNGTLFTAAKGYDGPGVGVGNGVFSIGTYGSWSWKNAATPAPIPSPVPSVLPTPTAAQAQATMQARTKAWNDWFVANSPSTERFIYLEDESADSRFPQLEQWAGWTKGILPTLVTVPMNKATQMPSLDISVNWIAQAPTSWQALADARTAAGKQYWFYNGKRPASGSFATEDDGVSLRALAWAQWKKKINRWFYWEATYYNDTQGGRGQTDVFNTAQTFGGNPTMNTSTGMSGWNSTNGDGVLLYPGTDKKYPTSSLGINGPLASLRIKLWRRGLQDVDYIALANAKNPTATAAIVNRMMPKALWEYGVTDASDPTWVRSDISWSINPDDWEQARADLVNIIQQ